MIPSQPILSSPVRRQLSVHPELTKLETPLLVFWIDKQPYALPITMTERLLRHADVTLFLPQPDDLAWVHGSFALDSAGSIRVYSLRSFWELPFLEGDAANAQALIVLRHQNSRMALLVDSCQCVIASLRQSTQFRLPGPVKGPRSSFLKSVVQWQDSLLVIVEIQDLIASLLGNTSTQPQPALCP